MGPSIAVPAGARLNGNLTPDFDQLRKSRPWPSQRNTEGGCGFNIDLHPDKKRISVVDSIEFIRGCRLCHGFVGP